MKCGNFSANREDLLNDCVRGESECFFIFVGRIHSVLEICKVYIWIDVVHQLKISITVPGFCHHLFTLLPSGYSSEGDPALLMVPLWPISVHGRTPRLNHKHAIQ